ncbi:hypothetical protein LCGC14_0477140 [marine sediment metagenome]|uniref:Uncharacterized protein n=1 Tax=marine sediment metagenome TaxID=412755 RepID=A0A0F9STF5_9ZZZZ
MNHRPKGWKNPHGTPEQRADDSPKGLIGEDKYCYDAFEAGADAMLEGLKKEGEYRKAYDLFNDIPHKAGTYIFIPEES